MTPENVGSHGTWTLELGPGVMLGHLKVDPAPASPNPIIKIPFRVNVRRSNEPAQALRHVHLVCVVMTVLLVITFHSLKSSP